MILFPLKILNFFILYYSESFFYSHEVAMYDYNRIKNWYSRESVQKALLEAGKEREVVCVYKEGNFGKRPDVLQFPQDILQAVAQGAVSFHGSVERWHQPMKLAAGMSKVELDELRKGWDIFIDPDVADFEIAKIVVRQILEALKDFGVQSFSLKFSGGKSFHIGIPFDALPEKINFQETAKQFPDLLHRVIEFLKWYIRDQLKESLLSFDSLENIAKRIGKSPEEISTPEGLDPYKVVSFDLFSSRHLFRLPYSMHEKSYLVSLPLKPEKLEKFEKENAQPEKVKVEEKFLQQKTSIADAEALVVEALDWATKHVRELKEELPRIKSQVKFRPIPEEYFPPCIKRILQGMSDGKKRSVFILINFLRSVGWDSQQIENKLIEWNQKNFPQLRTAYIRSQLRWHFRQQQKSMLPPNCDNENFYKSLGLYDLCAELHTQGIKNPVSWPLRQLKAKKKQR
jgi:hypothetical protein